MAVLDRDLELKDEAVRLARENAREEPSISRTYWFPHSLEIRLVHVDPLTVSSNGSLHLYQFAARGEHPFAVALIRPEEVGEIVLPESWSWEDGVIVYDRSSMADPS